MSFPLVQEQANAAEGRVAAQRAPELLGLGVLAVFVVVQGLAEGRGVGAVGALVNGGGLVGSRVFGKHVLPEFVFALAGVRADLADEGFLLVPQFVAAELVRAVAAVTALVAAISQVSRVFPHVNRQVMLPLGDVAALGAHVVFPVGVSEGMSGQIPLVSASELTLGAFVRLLPTVRQQVPLQPPLVRRGVVALRALVDLLRGVKVLHVSLELHRIKRVKVTELAGEPLPSRVTLPAMLREKTLVRTREVTVCAVIGLVRFVVLLHQFGGFKDGHAVVMLAFDWGKVVFFIDMFEHEEYSTFV